MPETPRRPLISVIITSYNYLHYIVQAIDSVRAQTYPNLEIVVVDNCSTDGTVPAIRDRYAGDPRVRIFQNESNIGEIANCNRGFDLSTGEFVLWLSADDWLLPRHLERMYALFEQAPQLDFVHSGTFYADAGGNVWTIRVLRGQLPFDYLDARDELVDMLTTTCPISWETALIRRSVMLEVGPEDPTEGIHATDWEMQVRIALAGKRFAFLQEPSLVMRLHEAQGTSQAYIVAGTGVMDYVGILEKYADHPGTIDRLRGREAAVSKHLDRLIEDARAAAGHDPFSPAEHARIDAQRALWSLRAGRYEPARVRTALVSVILPTPQSMQLTSRAIASVAQQTHPNWELVIVDHGPVPFGELLRSNPVWNRISYVRSPYSFAPGRARNFGMRLARGEFLAFLDEDNRWTPTHLAGLVDALAGAETLVAAAGARCILESADPKMIEFTPLRDLQIFRAAGEPVELSRIAPNFPLGALLLHRSMQDRVGVFDEALPIFDDFEYVLRLLDTPFAAAPDQTLEVRIRVQLNNALGAYLQQLGAHLERVYAAHPVGPALAAGRAAYRAEVERAVAALAGATVTVDTIAGLMAAVAGRGNP